MKAVGQEITLRSEWGFFEMTEGDWLCGQEQTKIAIKLLERWNYALNDQGNTARLLNMKREMLSKKANQPDAGC